MEKVCVDIDLQSSVPKLTGQLLKRAAKFHGSARLLAEPVSLSSLLRHYFATSNPLN